MRDYMDKSLNPETPHPYAIAEVSKPRVRCGSIFEVRESACAVEREKRQATVLGYSSVVGEVEKSVDDGQRPGSLALLGVGSKMDVALVWERRRTQMGTSINHGRECLTR